MAIKEESAHSVVPKKGEEENRQVEKIAMQVLQDKRKFRFARIGALALANAAGGRIEEKGAVISLAVVVAGGAKAQRSGENQKSGRKRPPMMEWVNQRRIEGGKVRSPLVETALECAECRVNSKPAENNDDGKYLQPPGVAP